MSTHYVCFCGEIRKILGQIFTEYHILSRDMVVAMSHQLYYLLCFLFCPEKINVLTASALPRQNTLFLAPVKRWNQQNDISYFSKKKKYIYIQYNLNGSNPDGSFTLDDSNSFFGPYKILPIAQENKYLGIFFLFYHGIVCCVYSLESPHRGDSNEYTQHTIIV